MQSTSGDVANTWLRGVSNDKSTKTLGSRQGEEPTETHRRQRGYAGESRRFHKPSAAAIAELLEQVAEQQGLPIPAGFRFLSYVQGKYVDVGGNNIRAAIDLLPDTLRRSSVRLTIKKGEAA